MNYHNMPRKELQKRLAEQQKLQVKLRDLNIKKSEIEAQVELGQMTERALQPIQTEIGNLMREINSLNNDVPQYLRNTCPDEKLHEEFRELQRRCIDLIDRKTRQKAVIEAQELALKERTEAFEAANSEDARQQYQKEIAACERELEFAREDTLDLERQLTALHAERDKLKRRMIAA